VIQAERHHRAAICRLTTKTRAH